MEAVWQAPQQAAARERSFLREWVLTVDHKKIGIMYGVTGLFFFLVGGLFALLVRTQLLNPAGTLFSSQQFNEFFTMHATVMIFAVIIPVLTGAFGNYLVPLQIGARDMAFPRMNALSYWLYLASGIILLLSMVFGMPDAGWTAYPPYSLQSPGPGIDFWVTAVHLAGLSSILGSINFIVTIFKMRAPGMTFHRMPLFTWSMLVTAFMQLFGTPALAGAVTTLLLDRHFGTVFYNSSAGGDPMLYQHLFWFYSHPAVYIMILPAFGIISEVLPVFSRKPIFGYHAIAYSSVGIGFLGFFVWAHHMFVAGMSLQAGIPFMITSLIIAVPTSVKIFNWLATMWRGAVEYTVPMMFASLGFIGSFIIGGFSGLIVASVPLDMHLHDTYFIVAHIHYVLFGGAVMCIMAGLHFWFPKVTGRMFNNRLGYWSFWLYFIGTQVTFFPMHFMGLAGMPRRIASYPAEFQLWNVVATIGAYILGLGTILIMINLVWSAVYGPRVSSNPWGARTLEWTVSSPPPEHNFDDIPVVTENPYQPYGEPEPQPGFAPV
ncbi:cytochrome c oxidase subunit 1 [Alicyclobacillus cellulosilyticus]|uniref:Cytochrome c oxidase subunit 1 n=1 Tax=Alicyclobacillus cellulosilyticus TaxID=1003997 RepID=A0A917NHQ0_9BACL|nr:cytochrome c oxidase subunit I [Alicyclobacillus cellulosilyticus]GGJ01458.1 cytochrome c oxidase subunit 1 [Alicyclobacillus cellulosilyticus]